MSPGSRLRLRYACLYAFGAVLPRPRGRERYTQDSLKTRLPSQFSDSSACISRCQLRPQKVDHYTRRDSLHAAYYQQHAW